MLQNRLPQQQTPDLLVQFRRVNPCDPDFLSSHSRPVSVSHLGIPHDRMGWIHDPLIRAKLLYRQFPGSRVALLSITSPQAILFK